MTSNFLYLGLSSFYYSSLRKTDTIVFAKLNKPPPPRASLLSSPSSVFEINKPPGGLIEDLRWEVSEIHSTTVPTEMQKKLKINHKYIALAVSDEHPTLQ